MDGKYCKSDAGLFLLFLMFMVGMIGIAKMAGLMELFMSIVSAILEASRGFVGPGPFSF